MTDKTRKFIDLMRFSVVGDALPDGFECDEEDIKFFYDLAARHDVSSVIAYALEKNGLYGDGEFSLKFQDEILYSAGRVTLLEFFYDDVRATLCEENVPFIPLKGAVIRKIYPEDFFRTSSDIDVLVRKEDFDRACLALKKRLKLVGGYRSSHDLALMRSPLETVEVHFSLIEDERAKGVDAVLKNAWEHAEQKDGAEYEFSGEFFMFYQIAHTLKHFEKSGCGIRFFIDLYFLRNFRYDEERLIAMLEGNGIKSFYDACEKLVDFWFCSGEADALTLKLQDFVLSAGIYGSLENYVAIGKNKRGGGVKYFFSRVFLPYRRLKEFYPGLEGKKWLTPFYEVRRWLSMISRGKLGSKVAEAKMIGDVDPATVERITSLFDELGIS